MSRWQDMGNSESSVAAHGLRGRPDDLDNRTVQAVRFDLDADQLFALQLGKQPIQNPGFCRTIVRV